MLKATQDVRDRSLVERWQGSQDERAFGLLLADYRKLIIQEARRVKWTGSEYADRVAAGHEGFLTAVRAMDVQAEGTTFHAFCRACIRRRIIDDWRQQRIGSVEHMEEMLARGTERDDDEAEPAAPESDDPEDDVVEPASKYEMVDPSPSPEQVAIARVDARALAEALDVLSDKQRRVIKALYFDGLSERDAAEYVGVTTRGVRWITQQALGILRASLPGEKGLDSPA